MKILSIATRNLLLGLFLPSVSLPAADVSLYGIARLQSFLQTNAANVVALPTNTFAFASFVIASTNFVVTNATVRPGSGTTYALTSETNNGVLLGFTNFFRTQGELDSAFPISSGSIIKTPVYYTMTMYTTNDSIQSGSLSFYLLPPLAAITTPTTPQVLNFTEAQAIDTTRDFTVQWNNLSGAVTSVVELIVFDAANNLITNSPLPGEPGALGQNSASYTLAANTLPTGTNLSAQLLIANPGLPNTTGVTGAAGFSALAKSTLFPLATRPAPTAPRLSSWLVPPQEFSLQFLSEPARLYQLEGSTNFTAWEHLLDTNGTGSSILLTLPAGSPYRFFRVKVGQ